MAFSASFNLDNLDGSNGFTINGIDLGDNLGFSASEAGDFNGDGIADIIIGAPSADPNGTSVAGESYVIFGGAGVGSSGSFDLASLNGNNGFVLNGIDARDLSGFSVSEAGDFNNDGFDDVIIGAPNADALPFAGESYVVYGGPDQGFGGSLDLANLDGGNGFVIFGVDNNDRSGLSVSSAGDVNGDGIGDLIIGAPEASPNGFSSGQSFVLLGGSGIGSDGSFNLANLDGSNGFAINGIDQFADRSGRSVSGAGDVNGDGFDDLIIGAPGADPNDVANAGESYVVFGGPNVGSSGSLELANLNGGNGFVLNGFSRNNPAGETVSGIGDINNDGIEDIIVTSPSADPNGVSGAGQSYVVFGNPDVGSSGSIELANLNGSNGFVINGIRSFTGSGKTASGAGDINKDGVDDLIVGSTNDNGSYVIYGRSDIGSGGRFNLADLNGDNGFFVFRDPPSFPGRVVSGIGDFNNDGIDDLITANPNAGGQEGRSYIVFGQGSGPGQDNNAPLAVDDAFTTNEDEAVSENVLTNDSDPDRDPLSATLLSGVSNGDLSFSSDGSFTYRPNPNFNGSDRFTYEVSDGALTDTATVSVSVGAVNDAPNATDDSFSGDEDTTVSGNVLENDSDADGDTLSAALLTNVSNGSLSLSSDGSFSYSPDPGFSGSDSFTYEVSDGALTDTATVSLNIGAVNDAPVAVDDEVSTIVDTAVAIDVLDNDTDADGDALSVSAIGEAANGSVVINGNGTVSYTPNPGFSGDDSFAYTVSDGDLTDMGTVAVSVLPDVNGEPTIKVQQLVDANGDGVFANREAAVAGGLVTFQTEITNTGAVAVTLDEIGDSAFSIADLDSLIGTTLAAGESVIGMYQAILPNPGATTVGTADADTLEGQQLTQTSQVTVTASDLNSNRATASGSAFIEVALNDLIAGALGDDTILGGAGDDVLRGDRNSRSAQVGEPGGNDIIFGGAGNDRIGGKSGNDTLFGEAGDDAIWGDDGDDLLRGGLGNDRLVGDNFSGGSGSDTFVLAAGEGTDLILDFELGRDLIGLADGLSLGALTFEGSSILFEDETLAVLQGVNASSLTETSFVTV